MPEETILNTENSSEIREAAQQQGTGEMNDWAVALPEALRPFAAQAKDMSAFESAVKHGLAHVPVTSAEEVDIPLPEGVTEDEAASAWFKEVAVKEGLSKSQIKALTEAYNAQAAAAPEAMRARAEKELAAHYGEDLPHKLAVAQDAAKRLDGLCDGALGNILRMGLGNHPDFIKAMVAIGEAVSDSALPGNPLGGGGSDALTTEDFINGIMSGKS